MRQSRLLLLIGAAIAFTVSLPAAQQPPSTLRVPQGRPEHGRGTSGSGQAPAAAPASNPRTDQFKRDVGMEVDAMGENIQKMNDMVFSFAEPGFQEFETSKYLTTILKQNGFTIQEGIAGIPTAWTATWGSGKRPSHPPTSSPPLTYSTSPVSNLHVFSRLHSSNTLQRSSTPTRAAMPTTVRARAPRI